MVVLGGVAVSYERGTPAVNYAPRNRGRGARRGVGWGRRVGGNVPVPAITCTKLQPEKDTGEARARDSSSSRLSLPYPFSLTISSTKKQGAGREAWGGVGEACGDASGLAALLEERLKSSQGRESNEPPPSTLHPPPCLHPTPHTLHPTP